MQPPRPTCCPPIIVMMTPPPPLAAQCRLLGHSLDAPLLAVPAARRSPPAAPADPPPPVWPAAPAPPTACAALQAGGRKVGRAQGQAWVSMRASGREVRRGFGGEENAVNLAGGIDSDMLTTGTPATSAFQAKAAPQVRNLAPPMHAPTPPSALPHLAGVISVDGLR